MQNRKYEKTRQTWICSLQHQNVNIEIIFMCSKIFIVELSRVVCRGFAEQFQFVVCEKTCKNPKTNETLNQSSYKPMKITRSNYLASGKDKIKITYTVACICVVREHQMEKRNKSV